jgi:CBS domain-containing protein
MGAQRFGVRVGIDQPVAGMRTATAATGLTTAVRDGPVRPTVGGSAATDPIRTIMATSVATVDGGASLRAVAEELAEEEVGALVVLSRGLPMSIVSERDVVRALAEGSDIDTAWAADLSAPETVWAETTDSIRDVAELMHQADVRHIPVREHGELAGIVSMRDVLWVLLEG